MSWAPSMVGLGPQLGATNMRGDGVPLKSSLLDEFFVNCPTSLRKLRDHDGRSEQKREHWSELRLCGREKLVRLRIAGIVEPVTRHFGLGISPMQQQLEHFRCTILIPPSTKSIS